MTPLRQRMINDMSVRGLAHSTMAAYLRSVTGLARHYRRRPDQISASEVQDYLLFLHQQRGLSWSTCNTVRHGARFFLAISGTRNESSSISTCVERVARRFRLHGTCLESAQGCRGRRR